MDPARAPLPHAWDLHAHHPLTRPLPVRRIVLYETRDLTIRVGRKLRILMIPITMVTGIMQISFNCLILPCSSASLPWTVCTCGGGPCGVKSGAATRSPGPTISLPGKTKNLDRKMSKTSLLSVEPKPMSAKNRKELYQIHQSFKSYRLNYTWTDTMLE